MSNEKRNQQILETELKRTATDLIARIDKDDVNQILVVGCIEQDISLLKARWKKATVIVVETAKISGDISSLGQFDLVFSNASIQYLPYHERIITKLFQLLKGKGVLAIHVPNAANMPINLMMESISRDKKWQEYLKDVIGYYFAPSYYYEILSKLSTDIQLWEINYSHILNHYQELIDLYAVTEMKIYLDKLPDEKMQEAFSNELLQLLPAEYKRQTNQTILFPFKRTFFIAQHN